VESWTSEDANTFWHLSCLDRTNVAQFSVGVDVVAQQLVVMGIRSQKKLGPASSIVSVLIDMYVDIGDSIALQYGGSEAHKKVTAGVVESTMPIGKASGDLDTGIILTFIVYSTKSY
jgi:hypothetical protein